MLKKHLYIACILVLCCLVANAQNDSKVAITLQKAYSKKAEKCIKKAQKFVSKRQEREVAYYYLSLSYFDLYEQKSSASLLTKSTRYYGKYLKYSKKSDFIPDEEYIDELQDTYAKLITDKVDSRKYRTALKYSKEYSKLFNDTVAEHNVILAKLDNPNATVKKSTENKTVPKVKIAKDLDPQKLIADASSVLGTRYRYGGESKSGMDCSGFNVYVYRLSGIKLPHNAQMQSALGTAVTRANCQPGDLIFYGSYSGGNLRVQHTGIVYSNINGVLKIIHCPNSGVRVEGQGDPGYDMYWEKRFLFIKRLSNNDLLTYQLN